MQTQYRTPEQLKIQAAAALELNRRRRGNSAPYHSYAKNPVGFVREILKVSTLTDEQERILISVRDRAETNVQAANGQGKTFIAACLALYWVYAVGGLCITTAPTWRQVKRLLWREINKMHRKNGALYGACDTLQLKLTDSAMAYGLSAKDTDETAFQGIHEDKLLAIQDEANGISESIDNAFKSCLTGSNNRSLKIGNPTFSGTAFFKDCQGGEAIKIHAFSHPNTSWAYARGTDNQFRLRPDVAALITAPDGSIMAQSDWPEILPRDGIAGAVTVAWIERTRAKYGEQSGYWAARVCAEFPADGTDGLIPRSWVFAACAMYQDKRAELDASAARWDWNHGLDVGDGSDPHALASRRGSILYDLVEVQTLGDRVDVNRAADLAAVALQSKVGMCYVDSIGVGSGALAQLIQRGHAAAPCNFGTAASDPMFANLRAQLYWQLREMLRVGSIAIALPVDSREVQMLADELAAVRYSDRNGRIQLEDKKLIRARLGRSPNLADAVAMAYSSGAIGYKAETVMVSGGRNAGGFGF